MLDGKAPRPPWRRLPLLQPMTGDALAAGLAGGAPRRHMQRTLPCVRVRERRAQQRKARLVAEELSRCECRSEVLSTPDEIVAQACHPRGRRLVDRRPCGRRPLHPYAPCRRNEVRCAEPRAGHTRCVRVRDREGPSDQRLRQSVCTRHPSSGRDSADAWTTVARDRGIDSPDRPLGRTPRSCLARSAPRSRPGPPRRHRGSRALRRRVPSRAPCRIPGVVQEPCPTCGDTRAA